MINWQDRISTDVKNKVDIELAAKAFRVKYNNNIKKGFPIERAGMLARQEMMQLFYEKNIHTSEAVHFLHVCEVLPYSGCGCCMYRKFN